MIELPVQESNTSYTLFLNPSYIISIKHHHDSYSGISGSKVCYSLGSGTREVIVPKTPNQIIALINRK